MQHPVVFFDGVCNLCNEFADWLLRNDPKGEFQIASLQGETARKLLGTNHTSNPKTIVLYDGGHCATESAAVLEIFRRLPQPWPTVGLVASWLPASFRDWIYRLIARHRYRLFGQRTTCRLPRPEEQSRFKN